MGRKNLSGGPIDPRSHLVTKYFNFRRAFLLYVTQKSEKPLILYSGIRAPQARGRNN